MLTGENYCVGKVVLDMSAMPRTWTDSRQRKVGMFNAIVKA